MSHLKDLTGCQFGEIRVLNRCEIKVNNRTSWDCICSCGNKFKTNTPRLLNSRTNCGCINREKTIIRNKERTINLTNKVVGYLTVIKQTDDENKVRNLVTWECLCVCENTCYIESGRLTNNYTTHCGCKKNENISNVYKAKVSNLIGSYVNKITVVSQVEGINKLIYFNCICDCGNHKKLSTNTLNKYIQKPYPLKEDQCMCNVYKQHGLSKTKEYEVYSNMKDRCLNPNAIQYCDYGGRGIKVCNRWLASFQDFIEDMGIKPTATSTIERLNVNGNYETDNCIWLERRLQNRNTRRNCFTELTVKEIKDLGTQGLTGAQVYHQLKEKYPTIKRSSINHVLAGRCWNG